MLRDRVMVRFGGTQEKQAFERELADRPDLMGWLLAGAQAADRIVAPRFRQRRWGRTLNEMNRDVDRVCEAGLQALRQGPIEEQPDESEVHFWRLGFVGAAYEARDIALGRGAPIANC